MNKLICFVMAILIACMTLSGCGKKTYSSTDHMELTVNDKEKTTSTSYQYIGKVWCPRETTSYYLMLSDGQYVCTVKTNKSIYDSVSKGSVVKGYRTIYYNLVDDSVDRIEMRLNGI